MEDRFVAAQVDRALDSAEIDRMLTATDWLSKLQAVEEGNVALWLDTNGVEIESCTVGFHVQLVDSELAVEAAEPANEIIADGSRPAAELGDGAAGGDVRRQF